MAHSGSFFTDTLSLMDVPLIGASSIISDSLLLKSNGGGGELHCVVIMPDSPGSLFFLFYLCVCIHGFLWRAEEGTGSPGAGVTSAGELLDVSAEN